jgi:hypothetical protein
MSAHFGVMNFAYHVFLLVSADIDPVVVLESSSKYIPSFNPSTCGSSPAPHLTRSSMLSRTESHILAVLS